MKFWTLQRREVVATVLKNGIYQPVFQKSTYLQAMPHLAPLYDLVLDSFNSVNGATLPGLIFAFLYGDNQNVREFQDVSDFLMAVRQHIDAIESLWKYAREADMRIVELDYSGNFNPIPIDINDFQFLMPPVVFPPPYTMKDFGRLVDNLSRGVIEVSPFPGWFIQAHLPWIRRENLTSVYDTPLPDFS